MRFDPSEEGFGECGVKPKARGEGAAFSPALLRISTNPRGEANGLRVFYLYITTCMVWCFSGELVWCFSGSEFGGVGASDRHKTFRINESVAFQRAGQIRCGVSAWKTQIPTGVIHNRCHRLTAFGGTDGGQARSSRPPLGVA